MSRWSASHVGTGTATSRMSRVNSLATVERHIAGMCLTVGTCALSTSMMEGMSVGHGPALLEPGRGGAHGGGGSMGTGTLGSSGGEPRPPGAARQFLHLEPVGTNVRQGSPHTLMLRVCRIAGGTVCPCDTCRAAKCDTKALLDLVMRESGHSWNGHWRATDVGSPSSPEDSSGGISWWRTAANVRGTLRLFLVPLPPVVDPGRGCWLPVAVIETGWLELVLAVFSPVRGCWLCGAVSDRGRLELVGALLLRRSIRS